MMVQCCRDSGSAKKCLTEKPMTTNSCQNMNEEKKYTAIIPFIGHPSTIFNKSLNINLRSINKYRCTIFKTNSVKNYFSMKDETPLSLRANVVHPFEVSCGKNQIYIGKTFSN